MRTRPLILCLAFLFVFATAAHAQDEASDLLGRVNALRTSLGLSPYSFNGTLSAAAQSQAQWMVETGNVSHSRPDGSTPRSRAQAAGYSSTFVSENIYGGTNASVNAAWNFWINSAIHYAGMTNPNYQDIGIGAAHGAWGATYVLVFGNPAGPPILPPQASGSGQNGSSQQPSFVVGLDANGNIMHEIQPGDTLGDIALIYGYTWDDIPYMMELNGLTDVRDLDIGAILLVPPYGGTYTPTPGDSAATPDTSATTPADNTTTPVDLGIITPTQPAPTVTSIPTSTPLPAPASVTPTAVQVASVATDSATLLTVGGGTISPGTQSPWLTIALVVQVVILVAAGVEFIRRSRR